MGRWVSTSALLSVATLIDVPVVAPAGWVVMRFRLASTIESE